MTTQEALNQIVKHFSSPDSKLSFNQERQQCAYRTDNGDRCAVGCLIPDELYHYEFEGHSSRMFSLTSSKDNLTRQLTNRGLAAVAQVGEYLKDVDTQFIVDAQNAHDYAVFDGGKPSFFLELKNIAKKHNLAMPEYEE